jgi:cyanophycin synthetase
MKIVEHRLLRGPNIHSPRPAFLAVLDLEDLDEVSSAALPGFADRLVKLIPTLDEHRCSTGRRGGFVERLHEGTYMAHIVEHVLIELQCLAGTEVGFGKARMVRGVPRHYRIVCSYLIENVVVEAASFALHVVASIARNEEVPDFEQRVAALRAIVRSEELGPSTRAVVEAARQRGIPVMRLAEGTSLFQLGWGSRAVRIRATITGRSSYIAVDLASDKQLTKTLLRQCGIPVPAGDPALSADEAVQIMKRIGRPVTIKPLDANQGKGVTVNIQTEEAARAAFEFAHQWSRRVIVEEYIDGDDHRVLVVGDRVVAASHRRPPSVTGDGIHTVRELADAENQNPLRGDGHGSALTRIPLDPSAEQELVKQGLTWEAVPVAGRHVRLRGNANLSTGGTAEDVTDRLHPDTERACVRAAQTIGLDVAGVDLVCRDVGRPLQAQRGGVIEVNAAPGIRMHEHPSTGVPRRAGGAIADILVPQDDGRIPTIAVTGTNGKTTTTLAIANVMRMAGYRTGVTTTEGVFIDGHTVMTGDCTGYWSARMVLTSPDVDAAVLETARGGILKRGLAFDSCDVGVVVNVQGDHLGQDGIDTIEDLAWTKGLVARTARRAAVLNADDQWCRRIADHVRDGTPVIFFTMQSRNETVAAHLARGERAVLLRGDAIVLAEGERRTPLVDASRLPFTLNGLARHNIANALAAAAAAWGAGVPREKICEGLATFTSTSAANPLRLNLYRVRATTVVMDYGHNAAAYRALVDTARRLGTGKIIGLVAAPGDRRQEEVNEIGAACTGFDEVVAYDMDDRRGRQPGEVAALVAAAVIKAGKAADQVRVVPDVRAAVRYGLNLCGAGDLLVYGCASHVNDLTDALPGQAIEELVVLERRHAHLARYADGHSVDSAHARAAVGWDRSRPERRRGAPRPYILPRSDVNRVSGDARGG